MIELIKYFTDNWVNWGICMVTILIIVLFIVTVLRFLIEVVIVRAFTACITHYVTMKGASEMAKIKLIKESNEGK